MEPADSTAALAPVGPSDDNRAPKVRRMLLALAGFMTVVGATVFILFGAGVAMDLRFVQGASSIFVAAGIVIFILSFSAKSIVRKGVGDRWWMVMAAAAWGSFLAVILAAIFPIAILIWILLVRGPG